jgi:hypothetical protein
LFLTFALLFSSIKHFLSSRGRKRSIETVEVALFFVTGLETLIILGVEGPQATESNVGQLKHFSRFKKAK